MGVAALISWLVTAFFGVYLLAVWLIEYDVAGEGAPASRLPTPVILGHVLSVLTGVVFWVIHLLSGADTQGWTAVGILAVIAALGLTMFTRWIPVHRVFAAAESGPGYLPADFGFPAEREFPVSVVAGHGVLAVATVTLVLLIMVKG
jgi:hypothetical protein